MNKKKRTKIDILKGIGYILLGIFGPILFVLLLVGMPPEISQGILLLMGWAYAFGLFLYVYSWILIPIVLVCIVLIILKKRYFFSSS